MLALDWLIHPTLDRLVKEGFDRVGLLPKFGLEDTSGLDAISGLASGFGEGSGLAFSTSGLSSLIGSLIERAGGLSLHLFSGSGDSHL